MVLERLTNFLKSFFISDEKKKVPLEKKSIESEITQILLEEQLNRETIISAAIQLYDIESKKHIQEIAMGLNREFLNEGHQSAMQEILIRLPQAKSEKINQLFTKTNNALFAVNAFLFNSIGKSKNQTDMMECYKDFVKHMNIVFKECIGITYDILSSKSSELEASN